VRKRGDKPRHNNSCHREWGKKIEPSVSRITTEHADQASDTCGVRADIKTSKAKPVSHEQKRPTTEIKRGKEILRSVKQDLEHTTTDRSERFWKGNTISIVEYEHAPKRGTENLETRSAQHHSQKKRSPPKKKHLNSGTSQEREKTLRRYM